jgi:hypothetical protein
MVAFMDRLSRTLFRLSPDHDQDERLTMPLLCSVMPSTGAMAKCIDKSGPEMYIRLLMFAMFFK